MTLRSQIRNIIVEVICMLFVLLFVYAAISKIIDYSVFRIQLGQSPILSPFAQIIAVLVPVSELILAFLLVFNSTRFWGLLGAFILMTFFTIYIYILLNYSAYVPCSCGGILERMTWNEHMVFNLFFVLLAATAFLIIPAKDFFQKSIIVKKINYRNSLRALILFVSAACAGVTLFLLFSYSDNIIHHQNRFIRRFPQHVAQEIYKIDLKYNSFYFAGSNDGKLYLGNYTAPLQILTIDTLLRKVKKNQITLREQNLPFKSPNIRVFKDNFFVFEGIQPYVFKGNVHTWEASLRVSGGYLFTQAQPMDSVNLAVRYLVPSSGEHAIGFRSVKDTAGGFFNRRLLEKQFDGLFDTDGILLYNHEIEKMIYIYYYRNEYLLINRDLKLHYKDHTIDTISKAQLKLVQYKNNSLKTLAEPPLMVNKGIATFGNMLYVNSALPGLYESDALWKTASIVDVYDLISRTYRSSFPIYDVKGRKAKEIFAYGNFLYVLAENELVCYKLRKYLLQNKSVKESALE